MLHTPLTRLTAITTRIDRRGPPRHRGAYRHGTAVTRGIFDLIFFYEKLAGNRLSRAHDTYL